MASLGEWVEGARLRTLPAAVAPVIAGAAIAHHAGALSLGKTALAAFVALALQVGVNFSNDYSDGIRGTDDERRVGPLRLVGSGAATPAMVKRAAFGSFGLACLAGLVLVALTQAWWLIAVGVACVVAAWFYTGGKRPYGYAGLGEVFVFVFFGLVAVGGTVFVQVGSVPLAGWLVGVAMGAFACAILVANNLRDIAGDVLVGKMTLAVRLGDRATRWFFAALVVVAAASLVAVAALTNWTALAALVSLVVIAKPVALMLRGATGRTLISVLKLTGLAELTAAVGLFVGLL